MLLIFSPCNSTRGNRVLRQNLTRNRGKVHRTLWELWIDVWASRTGHFFLGWGIWLPSNKNIVPALFNYNWLSAEWCNSLSKSNFFFLCAYTLCVFHLVGLGWYTLNKCHFSVVSSASFLSVDPFELSIPFLPLSSPVSFFHEQEGFTLLLCHPNWLH